MQKPPAPPPLIIHDPSASRVFGEVKRAPPISAEKFYRLTPHPSLPCASCGVRLCWLAETQQVRVYNGRGYRRSEDGKHTGGCARCAVYVHEPEGKRRICAGCASKTCVGNSYHLDNGDMETIDEILPKFRTPATAEPTVTVPATIAVGRGSVPVATISIAPGQPLPPDVLAKGKMIAQQKFASSLQTPVVHHAVVT